MTKKIQSLMIANRGEPVRRAIRTCRKLGIHVVTIATELDLKTDWASEADQCFLVDSYLNGEEIIKQAKAAKVDAIWPAWGFLSENEHFAKDVVDAGITWVGPSPHAIASMASKDEATLMAQKAGLTTIPEIVFHVAEKEVTESEIVSAANEVGYPILLKPALGGGGQGQLVISSEKELWSSWKEVAQINKNQFKNGPILVQKFFDEAKHIEAQMIADQHGNAVVLGERECSIQRRNQKVIEEAPSPALSDEERTDLFERSAEFARVVGYDNIGTIEYLYSKGKFYFLEMNTRLQVEHSISEEAMRANGEKVDLLERMIRIAEGEKVPFSQSQISNECHAIETRFYAEDPSQNYRPAPGLANYYEFPEAEFLRVESAFSSYPFEVSPLYDPMIAKVIVNGSDRTQAIENMKHALSGTVVFGLPTNRDLCLKVLDHKEFCSGEYTTRFLKDHDDLTKNDTTNLGLPIAFATIGRYIQDLKAKRNGLLSQNTATSFDHILNLIPENSSTYNIDVFGKTTQAKVSEKSEGLFRVSFLDQETDLKVFQKGETNFIFLFSNNDVYNVRMEFEKDSTYLSFNGRTYTLSLLEEGGDQGGKDPHAAPLVGQVVSVSTQVGDQVEQGDELYQIESMKMITTVRAKFAGEVTQVLKSVTDAVKAGDAVVEIPQLEEEESDENQDHLLSKKEIQDLAPTLSIGVVEELKNHFLGFDVSSERTDELLKTLATESQNLNADEKTKFVESLSQSLSASHQIQNLFENNHNALTFLAEQEHDAKDHLPHDQVDAIQNLLNFYGNIDLKNLSEYPRILLHLFQAYTEDLTEKNNSVGRWIQTAFQNDIVSSELKEPLKNWLSCKPNLEDDIKSDVWNYLYKLDTNAYYELAQLPVAHEYLDDFKKLKKNPSLGITEIEYENFLQEICTDPKTHQTSEQCKLSNQYETLNFDETQPHIQDALKKWFQNFSGRKITLPQALTEKNVLLYELIASNEDGKELPPRFVAVAFYDNAEITSSKAKELKIPSIEKAAIAAYRTLRLAQIGETHKPNIVLLVPTDDSQIPWKTRDIQEDENVLSPQNAMRIAARVGGFASGLQIESTEVILHIHNKEDQKTYWTVSEYRHSRSQGVMVRPPMLLEQKPAFPIQDKLALLNERQQKMGKLLNPDRATLLFDNGEYNELFFPEVDFDKNIGLNVYEGQVSGKPALAYAGDFRFRGGALGEREGKKLASAVVLAYLKNVPLIAFHDGAGANIKESISSLGWAGAYFGAIAHTGGFSNKEKFLKWLSGHIDREYFESVLNEFGLKGSLEELVADVKSQLLHFHLHVGATVGMLVYGASIAHASMMNNQPESYRVLTGSTTVKKVLGEDATNYSLGGAKAHSEKSGDIEMIFDTEEQVIDQTRKLIELFNSEKTYEKIQRDSQKPILETPKRAGIILGRAAIESHVDLGSFSEIRSVFDGAQGILTGYASLAGQPIAIAATATDYGLSNANSFKKVTLLIEAAQDLSLPVVIATGAQWECPPQPATVEWLQAREELYNALKRCTVPVLSLALGPRALEQNIHQFSDLHIYVKRGDENHDENERVLKLSPLACLSLEDAFDKTSQLVRYFPKNPLQVTRHHLQNSDSKDRDSDFKLPEILTEAYEMRDVINTVFDQSTFLELWSDDKLPLIAGLAALGEQVVGVIADNPSIESGAQNVNSIEKFTRLNRICERFGLPIVEINDSPAFRPGEEQEHAGIQGVGGRSIREECLSSVPKVAITLRQNYGGRLIHANLVTLGPDRKGVILDGAKVGVMGSKGAVSVLYGKKLVALPEEERAEAEARWQKEYEDVQLNPQKAVELGYVEGPYKATELRQRACEQLQSLIEKATTIK